jgi:predicted transcriptional regulator
MGWIDENNYVFIMVTVGAIAGELNWNEADAMAAVEELEKFGLLEIAEKGKTLKVYLKRFV